MLNELGFYRPTYDEIVAAKEQKAKELFGDDIDTSDLTPLGKFIRIDAYDLSKAYEDLELTYYARFPNTASGQSLDRLCVFAGISRNPPTKALHEITVNGTADASFEQGEVVVASPDDVTFYNIEGFTIPESGAIDITVEAVPLGTVGNVSTIDRLVQSTEGIDSITYVGVVEYGTEESDYSLRKRFSIAVEGAGSANINAIRAALLRVPGVSSAGLIENATDVTDTDGRPPHSFECFVYGDGYNDTEVAETIFEKAPIGIKSCSTKEEEDENRVEVTVIDDGGYSHDIVFSRTATLTIYIKISYKKNVMFEETGEEQIKQNLMEYVNALGVGTDVIFSSLYGYIYDVTGVDEVTSLTVSTDGSAYTTNNIVVDAWEIADLSADHIELVVVQ